MAVAGRSDECAEGLQDEEANVSPKNERVSRHQTEMIVVSFILFSSPPLLSLSLIHHLTVGAEPKVNRHHTPLSLLVQLTVVVLFLLRAGMNSYTGHELNVRLMDEGTPLSLSPLGWASFRLYCRCLEGMQLPPHYREMFGLYQVVVTCALAFAFLLQAWVVVKLLLILNALPLCLAVVMLTLHNNFVILLAPCTMLYLISNCVNAIKAKLKKE